ncbi:hypothetical protein CKO28_02800 [Rhodovibrio sodomensis]|uniref:Methyltransferase type 11 domain-containing protein n=1 Tax=Rhodovibrio sodomensis TaxID=1088 RepID=A0ABS1DAJ1_9PROT|nr:hypothetical protein [Rhodovibrio sodomensis]MBK1666971.1 hypothetical protein [Rhodovibrio sodomensis]
MVQDHDTRTTVGVTHPLLTLMDGWLRGLLPTDQQIRDAVHDLWASDRARARSVRDAYIRRFGFTVPLPRAVRSIADLGPIVEVGAGTGHLSKLISHEGSLAFATDGGDGRQYSLNIGAWEQVHPMDAAFAAASLPERTVLLSWPHGSEWPVRLLSAMSSGQTLVHSGEGEGGCCAGPLFFKTLHRDFEPVTALPSLSFPGIHDSFSVWQKR